MRFRSLVVTWCVCAIHGGVQTSTAASGHRSLDETSSRGSTRHPLGDVRIPRDVLLERSPRSSPGSFGPSFSVSPSPSRTDDREEDTVDRPVSKRGRRRKRRKKCSRRMQNARRKVRPKRVKLADDESTEESKSSMESSGNVKSSSASVETTTNVPTSTLNPTSEFTTTESSTIQHSTTDAVPSTTIVAKVIDDTTRGKIYQRRPLRKKCKRRKCATGVCKGGKKKNVIDVLGDEFFGKPSISQTPSSSSEGRGSLIHRID